jgi:Ca2+-binding RTX toxin-like protein
VAQITGTSGNDSLVGTSGDDTLDGLGGNDTLIGNAGNDRLIGGAGSDSLNGGLGNDTYVVGTGDTLSDSGGVDTVESTVSWTLASGFENLIFTGTGTTSGTGNELGNEIIGNSGNNWLRGKGGDDTLFGGAGNDTFNMSHGAGGTYGNDFIDGGSGVDTLDYGATATSAVVIDLGAGTASGGGTGGVGSAFLVSIENANGSAFDDLMVGSAAANFLFGYNGNDTLDGGAGNDRLEGGAGNDHYLFTVAPGTANADTVLGFAPGADKIVLDGAVHANLGAEGNFAAGDARFVSGAGLTSGQDATDRVIYNTTTGQLFYDADGNGTGAAQLIATLSGAPALAATDIVAQNSSGGGVVNGTQGNDSLTGTDANDTMNGLGGHDTLDGLGGDDVLDGGEGNDSVLGGPGSDFLIGGAGNDTLVTSAGDYDWEDVDTLHGGTGDDTYILDRNISDWSFVIPGYVPNASLSDAGGIDTVIARSGTWVLGPGFENLTLDFDFSSDGSTAGIGNELDNVIIGFHGWWAPSYIDGADGNDTLIGGNGDDLFAFAAGSGNIGSDSVDGGGGVNGLDFSGARSAVTVDFRAGAASGGGNGGSGSVSFVNISDVTGSDFADLLIGHDGVEHIGRNQWWFGGPIMRGGGGNDTLLGGAEFDFLAGDDFGPDSGPFGDDHLEGRGGGDLLDGGAGADWLDGGAGSDTLGGGEGGDRFVFREAPRAETADRIEDFASGADKILLDRAVHANLGAEGDFVAGDSRFFAGPGAISGQSPSHRVIYDTSTGTLYYDADGSGVGAAHPIATLERAPGLGATDISAFGEDGSTPPSSTITGTSGDDSLVGTEGADTMDGLAGNDTMDSRGGDDVVIGGSGNDSLLGGTGNDSLRGADGDDTLDGGEGIDTLDGGVDNDTYIVTPGDIITDAGGVDHVMSAASWFLQDGLENLTIETSDFFVEAGGNDLDNNLRAVGGDVRLYGRGGNDRLQAEGSFSITEGHEGNDTLIGSRGFDNLFGGTGDDLIDDRLDDMPAPFGQTNGANISGDAGNDTIFGGAADDLVQLFADYGQDSIDGGGGRDSITFEESFSAVVVNLSTGTATGGGTGGTGAATLSSVENVYGSEFNDRITGDSGANQLVGHSFFYHAPSDGPTDGNDTLDGLAGNDTLVGGSQADQFVFTVAPGAANADSLIDFGSGIDKIVLDGNAHANIGASGNFAAGDPRFFAGAGASSGQDASDRVVYNTSTGQLFYDADGNGAGSSQLIATLQGAPALAATDIAVVNGSAPPPPPSDGQTINGTTANDTLNGGTGDDTLIGQAGADTLFGREGNDRLEGGTGQDRLNGNAGEDSFVFNVAPGSTNFDYVNDFVSGTDALLLENAVFTNIGALGAFTVGDERFVAAAGARAGLEPDDRVMYDTSTGKLYYDADGSGSGGQAIIAVLQGAPALTATDIVVI